MSSQNGHYFFHVYGNICGIGGVFNNFWGQGKAGKKRYTILSVKWVSSVTLFAS
jgi:hypothetical protein